MTDTPGHQNSDMGLLVTREVRWFHDGPLPTDVVRWFTMDGTKGFYENRTDRYDLVSAHRGIGVKYRGHESFDMKYRVSIEESPILLAGFRGRIEDWVKVTHPVDAVERVEQPVAVAKQIITRRHHLPGRFDGADAGCDLELVEIQVSGALAWSFCVETFGSAEDRIVAFAHGVERLFEETPLPQGMVLTSAVSCSYPEWISATARALPDAFVGET